MKFECLNARNFECMKCWNAYMNENVLKYKYLKCFNVSMLGLVEWWNGCLNIQIFSCLKHWNAFMFLLFELLKFFDVSMFECMKDLNMYI